MRADEIQLLTPHDDVKGVLTELSFGLTQALGDQLVGLYLTRSLTYGDFDRGSSDIDYLVVLKRPMVSNTFDNVKALHTRIWSRYPEWSARTEGSYVTEDMLDAVEPPRVPRPYVNGGRFWDPDPHYGNEWLINLHALRECGIPIVGPEPAELIASIDIEDVRRASARDLCEEWVPKLRDPSFFESSHHQAFAVLTMCRILHRVSNGDVVSKRITSAWVRETYNPTWVTALIDEAE